MLPTCSVPTIHIICTEQHRHLFAQVARQGCKYRYVFEVRMGVHPELNIELHLAGAATDTDFAIPTGSRTTPNYTAHSNPRKLEQTVIKAVVHPSRREYERPFYQNNALCSKRTAPAYTRQVIKVGDLRMKAV